LVAPTRLTWICCGPTAATQRAAFPADEPLEESAIAKAQTASAGLERCEWAFAGPEQRVLQTATALGLEAAIESALRECDYGRWRGLSLKEVEQAEPDALARWLSDPHAAPHGGESLAQVMQRVGDWLDGPARKKGRGVAVSHPSIIRAAVLHAIGAPVASFWRVDVEPLSRMQMSHDGRAWNLRMAD
jgi:broad specificity phosphatase PhoE